MNHFVLTCVCLSKIRALIIWLSVTKCVFLFFSMATCAKSAESSYAAIRIVGAKYIINEDAYRFGIEWDPKVLREGEDTISYQPLDNLKECPTLVLDYDKMLNQEWKQKHPNSEFRIAPMICKSRKKVPHKKAHFEYIPKGNEFLKKIYSSWMDKSSEFYFVSFHGRQEKEIVRRPFLEYYYPVDVVIYKIHRDEALKKAKLSL